MPDQGQAVKDHKAQRVDCPFSKENQANHPKFERPNGKNTKSNFFFKSVLNWCVQLT